MKLIIRSLCVVLGCCLVVSAVPPQTPATSSAVSASSPYRALLDQYCVTCHNERAKTAGLMLDKMDVDHVSDGAETWEKVVRKLRGGMMPPQGRPRPATDDTHNFVSWLETSLDRAESAKPNPGRAA